MQNWRQAIKTPITYRVGNNSIRMQTNFVYTVATVGVAILIILYIVFPQSRSGLKMTNEIGDNDELGHNHLKHNTKRWYNATYPLTNVKRTKFEAIYKIGLISDLDTNSKSENEENTWISYLKIGYLTYNFISKSVKLDWEPNSTVLKSSMSLGGRGLELSELIVFNGKLYTVDDRTGIVYQVIGDKIIPWVILADGDGRQTKGFKSEWMAVKNEELYIGGLGKEWTSPKGELINLHPQWVKIVSSVGEVEHLDWHENYNAMRKAFKITYPGYLIHESSVWSPIHKHWFFLPRRASHHRYDEKLDEKQGTNLIIKCSENFDSIDIQQIGDIKPTRGFSSFKFLPGTEDQVIVAIKSEEVDGLIATYILVFSLDGSILLPETQIGDKKYEGIEFM